MNLHLTNSLNAQETFTVTVPDALDLHDAAAVLAAIQTRMPTVTRATVGKGYTDKGSKARATVWVWLAAPKPVAKPAKATQAPAPAKAPARYTLAELSRSEKSLVTRVAHVKGIRRDVAARELGLLGVAR